MTAGVSTETGNNLLPRERIITLDYFLCLISFFCLLLNNLYGLIAILGFLAPWGLVYARKKNVIHKKLVTHGSLLLLPACAMLSTIWSDDPKWTLKASAELFATAGIGIIAATVIKPRQLIAALMSALVIIAIMCVATMWHKLVSSTGDQYIQGIFGSKNQFSGTMSLLLLIAITMVQDKNQSSFFRLLAAAMVIFTPIMLYFGHSVGSIVAVILCFFIYVGMRFMRKVPSSLRALGALFFLTILIVGMTVAFIAELSPGSILVYFGKDASLTGRTYLWGHAAQYIADRPFLGTGYGAFWRIQNPHAQDLWYYSHVPPGAGFNFHNEYLEILVGQGLLGFTVLMSFLFIAAKNAYRVIFSNYSNEQLFAFIMFTYFLSRTPLELGIVSHFNIGLVIFCLIYIYLKPTVQEKAKIPLPPNFYVPPTAKIAP